MGTKEDLENIKSKLIEHINENYEEKKAASLISNINSMTEEEFITFIKEQGLLKEKDSPACIFCSIIFGDVPSTKIGENEKAIAILDINPASKGHALIIPKEHIESREKVPGEAGKLALEIKEKIKRNFSPKKIDLISANVMGHEVINVLPVYSDESLNSKRKRETPEGLEKIKREFDETRVEKVRDEKKEAEEINEKNTWLPKRIP